MKTKITAVYDQKSKLFMFAAFTRTSADATRAFTQAVNDKDTMLSRNPEDFQLYELGSFDDETGKVESLDRPEKIVDAYNVKTQPKTNQDELPLVRKI